MDIYTVANKMKLERKSIFDLQLRVTFYARVSSTTDLQENSVENQISFFEQMIKNNKNWTYVNYYADRVRGESAYNRKQFLQMIEDAKAGKFDLILAKEVSRFARNTIDSLTYTRELLKAGVGVFFQNDNICTIDTDSELRLTIMSSIAADEVRKLSERVKFGQKKAIENGHVLGNSRIFGYKKENCRLSVIEEEAEMVRLIFDLYSTGDYSVRKIEQILFDKGYRGRAGTRIHHNTISGIIQNPKYKGYFCGNKVKIADYRTKEQRFLPEDEWIMFKDESGEIVPAIVDEALWDKCNRIFKSRSEVVKNKGRSFKDKSALTGLIYCTVHDKAYWRTSYSNSVSKGEAVYQWICSEKRRFGTSHCDSFPIMEKELNEILADCINRLANNIDDYVDSFIRIYSASSNDPEIEKEISKFTEQLEFEKKKKDRLLGLYVEEAITKSEFSEQNDRLNKNVLEIEKRLNALRKEISSSSDYLKEVNDIRRFIKSRCTQKISPTDFQFQEIIKNMIERIDVSPIDSEHMNLEIFLKTGNAENAVVMRNSTYRRSGIISKKMIESYEQSAK